MSTNNDPPRAGGDAFVLQGDALEVLRGIEADTFEAVVTDPPYGLGREPSPEELTRIVRAWALGEHVPVTGRGFMGRSWDAFVPGSAIWREVFRVLKPGGHVLAFAGSRTVDLMGLSLRLAGFEIRDQLQWIYGSGFPKSLDVSKAIDKTRDDTDDVRVVCRWLRAAMERAGHTSRSVAGHFGFHSRMVDHWAARDTDSQPTLPTLEQWDALRGLLGFGDEMDAEVLRLNLRKGEPGDAWKGRPVTGHVAEWRDRTNYALTSRDGLRRDVAVNPEAAAWDGWGTALKPAHEPIIMARKPLAGTVAANVLEHGTGAINVDGCRVALTLGEAPGGSGSGAGRARTNEGGTLPGNGGNATPAIGRWPANVILDEAAGAMLDAQTRDQRAAKPAGGHVRHSTGAPSVAFGAERPRIGAGHADDAGGASRFFYCPKASRAERNAGAPGGNTHPTVKPIALMRWLVRLVTPPGGAVLDPFAGSGTTGAAAVLEGFDFVGVELDAEHVALAEARIAHWRKAAP